MTLFLFPNLLAEGSSAEEVLPHGLGNLVKTIQGLIAESEKGGRQFLRLFGIRDLPIKVLSEHTKESEIDGLLAPLAKGEQWGLVSDCGLPCLADPGSNLVFRARKRGIRIQALAGPSSISLALMLSGLPAQKFTFNGYLAREEEKLRREIRQLEKRSEQEGVTELFIEAPYRNQKMLKILVESLHDKTLLSVAWDLTFPSEAVVTETIAVWKKMALPDLHKKPAIFLIRSV